MARLGVDLGLDVELSVATRRRPTPTMRPSSSPRTAGTRSPPWTAALRAGVPYVALVASQKRGDAVLAALDVDDEQRARVHSPAGLDLGAHAPAEVALSILAELVLERSMRGAAEPAAAAAVPDRDRSRLRDDGGRRRFDPARGKTKE